MTQHSDPFHSPLAEPIASFLRHHRALGKSYDSEEWGLRLLDRYLIEEQIVHIEQITPDVLDAFLRSRPREHPRSYNHLLGVLQRLYQWMLGQQIVNESPLRARPRRCTQQRTPFLFEPSDIERLLKLAGALPDHYRSVYRGSTYRTIFALMYALGLRVSEVAQFCCGDLDLEQQCLHIRQTKFSKSRVVPFGPRVAQALRRYLDEDTRRHSLSGDAPLFSLGKDARQPIPPKSISRTFSRLMATLDLPVPAGVAAPRLHCLRHSFAVSTLLRWYRAGSDPAARLFYLSVFMGHVNPASTAVYLTITTDLLSQASERFERLAAPTLLEVAP